MSGEPPLVETQPSGLSSLIDEHAINELPLNGRSYDQLLTLNPGVVNYSQQRSGGTGTPRPRAKGLYTRRRPASSDSLLIRRQALATANAW